MSSGDVVAKDREAPGDSCPAGVLSLCLAKSPKLGIARTEPGDSRVLLAVGHQPRCEALLWSPVICGRSWARSCCIISKLHCPLASGLIPGQQFSSAPFQELCTLETGGGPEEAAPRLRLHRARCRDGQKPCPVLTPNSAFSPRNPPRLPVRPRSGYVVRGCHHIHPVSSAGGLPAPLAPLPSVRIRTRVAGTGWGQRGFLALLLPGSAASSPSSTRGGTSTCTAASSPATTSSCPRGGMRFPSTPRTW